MLSLSRTLALSLLIPATVVLVSTTTSCRRNKPKVEVVTSGNRAGAGGAAGSGFAGGGAWSPDGAPDPLGFGGTGTMGGAGFNGGAGARGGAGVDVTGSLVNESWGASIGDANFLSELDMIHFAFDSSEIPPEWLPTLESHAAWIQANPNVVVRIEGHTDERGTEEYNLSLGQRRADTVREFLAGRGVAPNRLETVSFGRLRPLSFDGTEDGHALNRRAMFLVFEVPNAQ